MGLDTNVHGGYGPQTQAVGLIGLSYDAPLEDMLLPAAQFGVLPRDLQGAPLRTTFPNWADGDILEVDLRITPRAQPGTASEVIVMAVVSIDGGRTWDVLAGSQVLVKIDSSGHSLSAIRLPGTVPPMVMVAYCSDGAFEVGGALAGISALGSVSLRCSRHSAGLVDQGPLGELISLT